MSAEDQDAIQEDIPVQDAEYQQDLGQTSTVPNEPEVVIFEWF